MIWQLDATALSALLDVREITPLQLLDQALARLDALEPMLNAFTYSPGSPMCVPCKAAARRSSSIGPM